MDDDRAHIAARTKNILEHLAKDPAVWVHAGAAGLDVLPFDRGVVALGVVLDGPSLRGQ